MIWQHVKSTLSPLRCFYSWVLVYIFAQPLFLTCLLVKTFLALQLSLSPHSPPSVFTQPPMLSVSLSLSRGETGDTKHALREERDPACYIQTHSRFRVDRTPIVPPCILLISWKRSSQHRGTGRVGWDCGVLQGWQRVNGQGWGGAPCWVAGFVQHAKARPCSPWMPTPPTVACMLVPDWHRNRASVKRPSYRWHTAHWGHGPLQRGHTAHQEAASSVEAHNYFMFCIHLLDIYTPGCLDWKWQQLLFHFCNNTWELTDNNFNIQLMSFSYVSLGIPCLCVFLSAASLCG